MKLKQVIEGMTILSRYFDEPDGYHTEAEHDVIYVHVTDRPIGGGDLRKLIELGWFQPEAEGDDFAPENYDPDKSWAAYP